MTDRTLPSAALLGLLSTLPACPSGGSASDPAASSASARPAPLAPLAPLASAAPLASVDPKGVPVGIPASSAAIAKAVNPKNEAPYSGPTGSLKGTVRFEGDPPPDTAAKIPSKCNEAAATYGKLFRVGLDKALADVFVAVTEYQGFVPAREPAVKITIHGCALSRRTMAVTFGQHIEVSNLDPIDPYMPYLDGAPSKAMMVAVPNGAPVKLYPLEPGHYLLRDQLPNDFLRADVFVVSYATHDVTGLDGQYEIKDIPVGRVKVNAFLPATDRTAEKVIEIKAGENTADFTLAYGKGAAAPSGAPSAAPAAPKGAGKK
jgi:hypothetical protein